MGRINIAIAGGPCQGKSTTAAALYVSLKMTGFDYDLVQEEARILKRDFGQFKDPMDRFFFWIRQEREELRSNAAHGFITDTPLFQFYAQVRQYAVNQRDNLALHELYGMVNNLRQEGRYQLVVVPKDPEEIPYKLDESRSSKKEVARDRHGIIVGIAEHMFWPQIFRVSGSLDERVAQIVAKVEKLHV